MTPFASTTLALALLAASAGSSAHMGYTGRNFGTLVNGSDVTIATQTVTSNYGWADASDLSLVFNPTVATTARLDEASFISGTGTDDLYLGDTHKGKAFRLHLDSTLTVTVTESARNGSGLMPAFSVYQGLAAVSPFTAPQTSADYDYNAAAQAWRSGFAQAAAGAGYDHLATQGSWNALGDWCMAGDGDPAGVAAALSCLRYVGSAHASVAGDSVSASFTLGPGDYTVLAGGADLAAKSVADASRSYALTLSVSAVPEPQAALLLLLGLPLLSWRRRIAQR